MKQQHEKIDKLLRFGKHNIQPRQLSKQFQLENLTSSNRLKYSTTTPENPIVIDDNIQPKAKTTNLKRTYSSSLSLSFTPENKSPSYCPLEEISPPGFFDDMSNVSSQSNKLKNEANPALKRKLSQILKSSSPKSFPDEKYSYPSTQYCEFEEISPPINFHEMSQIKPIHTFYESPPNQSVQPFNKKNKSNTKTSVELIPSSQIEFDEKQSSTATESCQTTLVDNISIENTPTQFKLIERESLVYVLKENIPSSFVINNKELYFQKEKETLAQATLRIFQNGFTFETKKILRDLIFSFAVYWEFCIATDGCKFTCNRAGLTSQTTKSKLKKGPYPLRNHRRDFKCDCKWVIHYRYENPKEKTKSVKITTVVPQHTYPCIPSRNQYIYARKVSGQLTQYVDVALNDIVNQLTLNRYIDPTSIRNILERCFPGGQSIDFDQINNARLRAQMIIDKARMNNQDPSSLASLAKTTNITKSIDYDASHSLDKAVQACENIFYGIMNTCQGNNKLVNFLFQLASHDDGFSYKIFFNKKNEISGFMWMTSTMRSNFERFGSFLAIDAMKGAKNIHLWPYVAPVVVNEFDNTCVVAECLVAGERKDAYIAILKGLSEMAPGRPKTKVYALYADEFLSEDVLRQAGYEETKLFYDHVHLRNKFHSHYSPIDKEVSLLFNIYIYIYLIEIID